MYILKNSIEHSNSGNFVEINYTKNKVYYRIVIRDNGLGKSKKELPHIFERFYKGHNSNKTGTIFTIKYFE